MSGGQGADGASSCQVTGRLRSHWLRMPTLQMGKLRHEGLEEGHGSSRGRAGISPTSPSPVAEPRRPPRSRT